MSDSAPEAAHGASEPWIEAAAQRLERDVAPIRRLSGARRRRMRDVLAALAGRHRGAPEELEQELAALIELIGLGAGEPDGGLREFAALVRRGEEAGLDRRALPHVVQAYVRATGRIVAVETAVMLGTLREIEPARRAEVAGRLIDALLPSSVRGFDLLHRAMLQDAVLELSEGMAGEADQDNLAVGMVDLVGSTAYLQTASAGQLEALVDAIFAAGQAVTAERAAHIVKYVGDGVFLAANDVASVADAAAELTGRLEARLPLRARGGVSYGFVVQRAGDIFGMPVNMAQALTKAAQPGTVLLSRTAAELLPAERRGRLRERELPHPALGRQRVATLRERSA